MNRLLPRLFFVAAVVVTMLTLPDCSNPEKVYVQNPFERNLYVEAHRGLEAP